MPPKADDYIHDLAPEAPQGVYPEALAALKRSRRVMIGHIDAGIAPHPALGFAGDIPPSNILMDLGANLYDPENDPSPVTPLRHGSDPLAAQLEYPDHGVKTLSAILGHEPEFRGVAPWVKVVPYRVSNGPLFRNGTGPMTRSREATALIGAAIDQAVALTPEIRVITISMGNPGWLGVMDFLVRIAGGGIGMDRDTGRAVDRAYEKGVILCCAAGQVIDRVVYPARYSRTIAVGGVDKHGGLYDHYPPEGYAEPAHVDVWAQAKRLNRASYLPDTDPPVPVYADDPRAEGGEPSGTSYATPQVAAAAALWVERHYDRLEEMFADERWKIVEAFRAALRGSARSEPARLRNGSSVPVRVLDIPRLLSRAPAPVETAPAARAVGQGFW
ncbi:S8/S53 family peptidase [Paroceanicella profunda]|uniref:S8/S53 family peptidase n=1 Tax=Paroceanicella profunda TaxID=2579971 RepID=A0A5B8FI70_9RHOB|nr:S8 family serine peptidase [Paroceanicella profunda]QDL92768.1 S8/S53 family peptidase [Paroceanicella profunda]